MSLASKTIVVTGAASGIGAETAAELQRQGAVVFGVDRHPVAEVGESMTVDLTDRESISALISSLPLQIDGLANVAGLPPTSPPGDVIKVNLRGLQMLTLGLIPKLANGASIVNLASSAGNRWVEHLDEIGEFEKVGWDEIDQFAASHSMEQDGRSYFFSKEALVVWTMQNRWTWLDRGIRMNAVSPGPIDTPILRDFVASLGPRAQRSIDTTERVGRPGDVAPVVAFLMSDAAAWFRGANLTPDGGLAAHMKLTQLGLE